MSRKIKIAAVAAVALLVSSSLFVGARVAFASQQSLICHTYTSSETGCQSYCMATYGPDWGYQWNPGNQCCQCLF